MQRHINICDLCFACFLKMFLFPSYKVLCNGFRSYLNDTLASKHDKLLLKKKLLGPEEIIQRLRMLALHA